MSKHKCHRSRVESVMTRVRSGCQRTRGILRGFLCSFLCTVGQNEVKSVIYFLLRVHFLQIGLHDTTTHNWEPQADGLDVSQLVLRSWFCGRTEPSCSSWSWGNTSLQQVGEQQLRGTTVKALFHSSVTSDFATWASPLLPLLERESLLPKAQVLLGDRPLGPRTVLLKRPCSTNTLPGSHAAQFKCKNKEAEASRGGWKQIRVLGEG